MGHQAPWMHGFLRDFVGLGVLQVHRKPTQEDETEALELFVDLERLLESPRRAASSKWSTDKTDFIHDLENLVDREVPASVAQIVYVEGSASSQALGNWVLKRMRKYQLGNKLPLVAASQLTSKKNQKENGKERRKGTTLVVAGTFVTGRALAAVGPALRGIKRRHQYCYLIGIARCTSPEHQDKVERDLKQGGHGLHHVRAITIPDNRSRVSPWTTERDLLLHMRDEYYDRTSFRAKVNERLAQLDTAEAAQGLTNDLFWGSLQDGTPLQLRPEFVFWDFAYESRSFTQADVYFTIAALLFHRRNTPSQERVSYLHEQLIWDPENFTRFSDGVIQAALLRAARDSELQYQDHDEMSRTMRDHLLRMIDHPGDPASEALMEFLLSIALGKLTMQNDHTVAVMQRLLAASSLGEVPSIFGEDILKRFKR